MEKIDGRKQKGPRPALWRFKDPFQHDLHRAWAKHRAQAHFRKEEYHLTVEDYFTLWTPETFRQKNSEGKTYTLTRKDWSKPWSLDNVELSTRSDVANKKVAWLRQKKSNV